MVLKSQKSVEDVGVLCIDAYVWCGEDDITGWAGSGAKGLWSV